ncbi:uncharacterized protein RJT20DRAFT_134637 [Scheffersomyces xylosifermentans]|uniref:uncharacterized protein n=1 Tax=Scheffersomyces xylosifermentans TaxID=1304137 RepID=UPI00315CE91D
MVSTTRSKTTKRTLSMVESLDDALDSTVVKKSTKKTSVTKKSVKIETPSSSSSPKKSPRKAAAKKIDLEDSLDHIIVPKDFSLPEDFVEYHEVEFLEGLRHLIKQDPSLYAPIVHMNFPRFAKKDKVKRTDEETILYYWYALISSVISQQVSGAAARSIENKFKGLFGDEQPTPSKTLSKTTEELRSAGLSSMKTKYVLHISEVFSDPDSKLSNPRFYEEQPLDVIINELVTLKGIGEWSAKMFAIFTLNEKDVFAYDDLGIARGMSKYLLRRPEVLQKLKDQVREDEIIKALLKKKSKFDKKDSRRDWTPYHDEYVKLAAEAFSPHKTALMLVLWRLGSTNIEVLEN